jgi:hypothetical protein
MFKGQISARVNRFGQESTQHLRPLTRADYHLLDQPANAVLEISCSDRPLVQRILLVHPDCFKSPKA